MDKNIKANKDNNLKFMEGVRDPYPGIPSDYNKDKDKEKKESTDLNSGPLEYFTE